MSSWEAAVLANVGIQDVIEQTLCGIRIGGGWSSLRPLNLGVDILVGTAQCDTLTFYYPAGSFGIRFLRDRASGIVNIEANGQCLQIDLYSESSEVHVYMFEGITAETCIKISVAGRKNNPSFESRVSILGIVTNYFPNKIGFPLYDDPPRDMLARDAIDKLLAEYEFDSVLDVGAGRGDQSKIFVQCGKAVTAILAYDNIMDEALREKIDFVYGDYLVHKFPNKFDLIWASHILEHQRNIGAFLEKAWADLNDEGILAISVPPAELLSGGGHVNYFSEPYLIYHCLINGFDLSDVRIKRYGYNLSLICRKRNSYSLTSWAPCLSEMFDRLPDYIVSAIKNFIAQNAGHERIPEGINYKW